MKPDNIDGIRNLYPKIRNIYEINPEVLADEYGTRQFKEFITLLGKRYKNERIINLFGGVGYWEREINGGFSQFLNSTREAVTRPLGLCIYLDTLNLNRLT